MKTKKLSCPSPELVQAILGHLERKGHRVSTQKPVCDGQTLVCDGGWFLVARSGLKRVTWLVNGEEVSKKQDPECLAALVDHIHEQVLATMPDNVRQALQGGPLVNRAALLARLSEICQRYETSAPTVVAWADDLYIRLGEKPDSVLLSEIYLVESFVATDGDDINWLAPNGAANAVYHLQYRLGRDTTGHVGF